MTQGTLLFYGGIAGAVATVIFSLIAIVACKKWGIRVKNEINGSLD